MLILSIFKAESLMCYRFGAEKVVSEDMASLVENRHVPVVTSAIANLSAQLTEQNVVTCPRTDTSCIMVEYPENSQLNFTLDIENKTKFLHSGQVSYAMA